MTEAEKLYQEAKALCPGAPNAEAFALFLKSAELGYVPAQHIVGLAYSRGCGTEKNPEQAFGWFEKAAQAGHPSAQNDLGCAYLHGVGVPRDAGIAAEWFRKGAQQQNAQAIANLAFCYGNGQGVPQDQHRALELYKQAADMGVVSAMNNVGYAYFYGAGVEQDYAEAAEWYRKAAEKGHAGAQHSLAHSYFHGKGLAKDYERAFYWYEIAAKKNHPGALNGLGVCYQNGFGVSRNLETALKLFEGAMELGSETGKQNYEALKKELDAQLAQEDPAVKLFREAQEREAQQDSAAAFRLYERAAQMGHAEAQYKTACAYYDGAGTEQDYDQAFLWYRKAADQNHPGALNGLGLCYRNGHGVEADKRKALDLFRSAMKLGNKESLKNYTNLKRELEQENPEGDQAAQLFREAQELDKKNDYVGSFKLYLQAAEMGHAEAQYNVGYSYYHGEGVVRDYAKAFEWYQKAANQDHPESLNGLGICYKNGKGVSKDPEKALELFRRAMELGNKSAQKNYESLKKELDAGSPDREKAGQLYKEARTLELKKDHGGAFRLYLQAANMGHAAAQFCVGYAYLKGIGEKQDLRKALEWLRKSADQKYAPAFVMLGDCYREGKGVPQSSQQAMAFYGKAAGLGDEQGKLRYEELKKELEESGARVQTPKTPEPEHREASGENTVSAEEELGSLIGLSTVKQEILEMVQLARYQQSRKKQNKKTSPISMHMVFTGNPGTGKTTVARIVARMYYEMGILEKPEIVEAERADLVAEYMGQTAAKTRKVIDRAMGGVLFIDEAYTLAKTKDPNDFGAEAIETLLKAMEDHRDKLMVIVAGYTAEMHRFINSNPGLKSRFKKFVEFGDYNGSELANIFLRMARTDEYAVTPEVEELIFKHFDGVYRTRDSKFANGRVVRNFYQDVIAKLAVRAHGAAVDGEEFITAEDIQAASKLPRRTAKKPPMERLEELVGLEGVKQEIDGLVQLAKYQKKCRDAGLRAPSVSMHMVFSGNPGTGKTTVARLLGEIYHELGLLSRPDCLEVDRSKLVGEYVGHTAVKTREIIEMAMGGVLFIDEAYTLSRQNDDFGREAIETLLKLMEDSRENLVVIVAGYTEEMNRFLASNPGLMSRFTKKIRFADYTAEEMEQIFRRFAGDYTMTEDADAELGRIFREMEKERSSHPGNGRDVRNFYETVITMLAFRAGDSDLEGEALKCITSEDVLAAEERMQSNSRKAPAEEHKKIGFL